MWDSQGSVLHVGNFAILREHCGDDVHNNLKFRLVRGSHIDKDVFRVQSNFAVVRVNNRWHRQNAVVFIVNDWIDRRIFDDMQVSSKMFLRLGKDRKLLGSFSRLSVHTSYTVMSSSAVYAESLFSGTNLISFGFRASYRNGAWMVSRSCVPTATSWRRRHRF